MLFIYEEVVYNKVVLDCPGGTRFLSIRGVRVNILGSEILQQNHIWGLCSRTSERLNTWGLRITA